MALNCPHEKELHAKVRPASFKMFCFSMPTAHHVEAIPDHLRFDTLNSMTDLLIWYLLEYYMVHVNVAKAQR